MAPQSIPNVTKSRTKQPHHAKYGFENEHLAYTKQSFSRVQGAKNTPKVNQSRSEGLSKITSIFTSILGLIFLNFDSILGSQSQPFGTHNHPLGAFWDPQPFPGPSFGTPSLPLDPLASDWGPFDTLPGSGESLPGPNWDPWGPLRTTPGIPRLHLGPSGCPSWQPLVFLFGTGAGGRGGACKSAAAPLRCCLGV
jgi:hypothetical protein